MLLPAALFALIVTADPVADSTAVHLRFESSAEAAAADTTVWRWQPDAVATSNVSAGKLIGFDEPNTAAGQFDGATAIGYLVPPESDPAPFAGDFTWEGFFLTPGSATLDTDGAIGDRFISQYRDGTGSSTRLTVGLSTPKNDGPIYLCLAMAGSGTRHVGKTPVEPDCWHHFAVVLKTAESGNTLSWYLNHQLEGEVKLNGSGDKYRLVEPGTAALSIGGRLKQKENVDRGFNGLLDEIRLSNRALTPAEFLRAEQPSYERLVAVDYFDGLRPEQLGQLDKLTPHETIAQESFTLSGMPTSFSMKGNPQPRGGWQGLRARRELSFEPGPYRLFVRTEADTLLKVDGQVLLDARGPVGKHPLGATASTGGPRDYFVHWVASGKPQAFELQVAFNASGQAKLGDVVVGVAQVAANGQAGDWQMLGYDEPVELSPTALSMYRGRLRSHWRSLDDERRLAAIERGQQFWTARHAWSRSRAAEWNVPQPPAAGHPVDAFLAAKMQTLGVKAGPTVDDATFLRRVTLDLAGRAPTWAEVQAFAADTRPDRREQLVDRLLDSPEWADSWMGYWQDVLAENPSILKPALNNTGAFRTWIHRSLDQNVAMDQFVTELLAMEGDDAAGGTAGFAMAAMNDVPMAMKAHVVAKAFVGLDLNCARCHDSPVADFQHSDLFHLAAMLGEKSITVPESSTVVVPPGGRIPDVTSDLTAGQRIAPHWPLTEIIPDEVLGSSLGELPNRPRMQLAAILTSPEHPRFVQVMANRVWKRYFGVALVEPVDNWIDLSDASHPELLEWLGQWFVLNDYDLKALARLLVTSEAYARAVEATDGEYASPRQRTFAWQTQRRLSAEQLVDSMFKLVGKSFQAEELSFDPNRTRGFLSLPAPERSWQMASLSNERDRPALSLPVNMLISDVLGTFGWRESRADPITDRDEMPNPLQPLMMANGTMVNHLVRLTEDNLVTEWCLEDDLTPESLAERLFLGVLSRRPSRGERQLLVELLADGFESRRTGAAKPPAAVRKRAVVDWDKHLEADASVELLEYERQVLAGDPPTVRLTDDFRQRVEDAVWCLFNSPEFLHMP